MRAERIAGVLVLVVGLVALGIVTFKYRDLNDPTAIAFAVGAILLALGVLAVIAVPLLNLPRRANRALVTRLGWIPGFGLMLTGITHFTDWTFFRDHERWLALHRHRPTLDGVRAEGVVLTALGLLLIIAAMLAVYALPKDEEVSS